MVSEAAGLAGRITPFLYPLEVMGGVPAAVERKNAVEPTLLKCGCADAPPHRSGREQSAPKS